MHFAVDAVSAESFAQWVDATRSKGPVLDTEAYADLAKPSEAVVPFTYGAVASDLFTRLLSAGMHAENSTRLTYSHRTEP